MGNDIFVVTGPPGAGKSTTARALAQTFPQAVHLHTDDFWHDIVAGGIPPYLPEADQQNQTVLRVIVNAAFTFAAGGYTVVVDGVVGPWMLHHFRDGAAGHPNSRLHYIVLRPNRVVTLTRAKGRTAPNALLDAEPILAMWDQFADLNDLEHHVIDTSQQSADDTLKAVATAVPTGRFVLSPTGRTYTLNRNSTTSPSAIT
ncbi:ATP-binding protein [Mycolicibacter terrae]|uniref:Shikimate kinase n=2 Tax=Mycolicibacter TaxID=1073531 RepID=A0A1A2NLB2_MYCSD|nr:MULTISPECIES: AAA family ATPase [Mycolicibacter]OBH15867.1 shikimate kinase [Mycolicibacter sinensis]OBI26259.1 shikimate kinase [Mycolicibacter sinensis]RRR47296.1 ATP-binding protein [Mycolicibacter terrae]